MRHSALMSWSVDNKNNGTLFKLHFAHLKLFLDNSITDIMHKMNIWHVKYYKARWATDKWNIGKIIFFPNLSHFLCKELTISRENVKMWQPLSSPGQLCGPDSALTPWESQNQISWNQSWPHQLTTAWDYCLTFCQLYSREIKNDI